MELDRKYNLFQDIVRRNRMYPHLPKDGNLPLTAAFGLLKLMDSEKQITVPDLQRTLQMGKSAVSQMLNTLEEKGLIVRSVNVKDRRRIDIEISPAGKKLMTEMKHHVDWMVNEVIDRFGEEKSQQLAALSEDFAVVFDEVHREVLVKLKEEKE